MAGVFLHIRDSRLTEPQGVDIPHRNFESKLFPRSLLAEFRSWGEAAHGGRTFLALAASVSSVAKSVPVLVPAMGTDAVVFPTFSGSGWREEMQARSIEIFSRNFSSGCRALLSARY
jgi:hypothetical protein